MIPARFRIGCAAGLLVLETVLAQPPATPKKPVTDVFHGVVVTDDYRWLENYSDPAVRAWSDAQNRYARQYLDALAPRVAGYEEFNRLY
jgi:prolyl oligopeptidase